MPVCVCVRAVLLLNFIDSKYLIDFENARENRANASQQAMLYGALYLNTVTKFSTFSVVCVLLCVCVCVFFRFHKFQPFHHGEYFEVQTI